MSFQIGDHIGDYQIIEVLGTGGMGKVYKVRNTISERVEAMKVLLPDLVHEPELADRFLREIKVLASLNHPNIASLHAALRVENQLVMIMELVEGITLDERLRKGPIPLQDGIDYFRQVLSALSYAHARGVIHRDIKPANMMLTPGGIVKLMDFGIAKAAADQKLTMTGSTMGSVYYMSPEQVKGVALDARSDLYSLGVSLYEIVTGARPFQGDSNYGIMASHLQQAPRPPIELDPKLPPALNEIILMSLAKDPAQRFQSADAFRVALESVRSSLGPAVTETVSAAGLGVKPSTPQDVELQGAGAASIESERPAPPPQAGQVRSHRGLYMALGAGLAIAVIVLAATQLPKWYKIAAGGSQRSAPSEAPTQANTSSPAPQSSDTTPAVSPPVSQAAPEATAPPSSPQPAPSNDGVTSQSHENAPAPSQRRADTTPLQGVRTQGLGPASSPSTSRASKPSPFRRQPGPTATPSQSEQPSGGASVSAGALQDLQERMVSLTGRASAVKDSVQNIQRQQNSEGLSMRPDIAAALSRMERFMNEADAALSAGNSASAQRNMDLAEREIEKLEKFLGR